MGKDLKKCRKENATLKQKIENLTSFSRDRVSTIRREGDGKLKSLSYYTADSLLKDLDLDDWERLGDARRAVKQGAQKRQGGKRKTRKRRSRAGRKRRKKTKTKKKRHIITRKNKRKRRRRTKKRKRGGMPKGPKPKKSGLLPPKQGVIKPKHIRLRQLKKGLTRSPTVRNLQQLTKFKPIAKERETEEQSKMDEDLDNELSNIFGNMNTPTDGERSQNTEKMFSSKIEPQNNK